MFAAVVSRINDSESTTALDNARIKVSITVRIRVSNESFDRTSVLIKSLAKPYLQMMYAVWPMLSISSIEKIEAKNRQLSRLIHNWWDATNDQVRWLPNYLAAELKAQRFLRRFIDKAEKISPELFEDCILSKAMPMYLRMHIEEEAFIDALPRGRLNRYIQ